MYRRDPAAQSGAERIRSSRHRRRAGAGACRGPRRAFGRCGVAGAARRRSVRRQRSRRLRRHADDARFALVRGQPPATADDIHVARLRKAGAIAIGKTAAPEFGAWAYTASPLLGVTRNPWNTQRTPGGSSGGSSAAVSAGLVPFCTASDGGGSIRTPAAFTGLVGLKCHLRAHSDVRRNAHRAERGRRQPGHDRYRHRATARCDGRTGRARPHLPAAAERQLCRGPRRARRARYARRVVARSRLRDRRARSGRVVRIARRNVDESDRRTTRRREGSSWTITSAPTRASKASTNSSISIRTCGRTGWTNSIR